MTKKIDYKKKYEDYKKNLVDEYEDRFDDYKQNMAEMFSAFVDTVLEKELIIPEKVIKYAKCGELYEDLMRQFKVRLGIDAGMVREDIRDVFKDAKEEIVKLNDKLNKAIGEGLQLQKDRQDMAALLYIRRQIRKYSLPEDSTLTILSGAVNKEEIDKKIQFILDGPVASARDKIVEENAVLHKIIKGLLEMK